jgi:hypothetical protein
MGNVVLPLPSPSAWAELLRRFGAEGPLSELSPGEDGSLDVRWAPLRFLEARVVDGGMVV